MVLEGEGTGSSLELFFSWEEGQALTSFCIDGGISQHSLPLSPSASCWDLEVSATRIQSLVSNARVNTQRGVMD